MAEEAWREGGEHARTLQAVTSFPNILWITNLPRPDPTEFRLGPLVLLVVLEQQARAAPRSGGSLYDA